MKLSGVYLSAILAVVLGFVHSLSAATYSGGSGTAADPYQIANKADLLELSATTTDYDKRFILMADIDLDPTLPGGQTFTRAVIAPDINNEEWNDFQGTPFTGVFDGNGKQISNLAITGFGDDCVGLFGYVGSGGLIMNLGVVNANIQGRSFVGELVGENYYGTITSCYATGAVYGDSSVGGLVGENRHGTIDSSYATGAVYGNSSVGGLAGLNDGTITSCYTRGLVSGGAFSGSDSVGGLVGQNEGTITFCYATGAISGTAEYICIGGLVGQNEGTITFCYATGAVSGGMVSDYVGGLVGKNSGTITSCFATGAVSQSGSRVGGLVGWNYTGTITSCHARGAVSGNYVVGGLLGYNYKGKVIRCFSTGKPTGISNVGGLCGYVTISEKYENTGNFWDMQTSTIAASRMGTGKTTAEMQTLSTFVNVGWDFSDNDGDAADWQMPANDYPRLAWEQISLPCNDGLFVDENADYVDFSIFSRWWLADCGSFNYWCCGADISQSGGVDLEDIIPWIEVVWLKRDPISDHVFNIAITNSWDYSSPDYLLDDRYVLYVEIETDDHVDHIDFVSPAGNTFTIPNTAITEHSISGGSLEVGREFDSETGRYYWCYAPRFNAPDFLAAYGDGLYTFTVYYSNGRSHQTSAWFGIPNTSDPVPQPIQTPVFTSFHYGDTLTSPVIFTWQPCTDLAAGSIEFDPQHVSGYEMEFQLPVSATGLSSPLVMIPGYWEDIELSFERNYWSQNADGITILASKYSESDYEITVQ